MTQTNGGVSARMGTLKSSGKDVLLLSSPFHPAFAQRAKALGGKWDAAQHAWVFDPRDSDRVATVCREMFGCDWTKPVETATVRLTLAGGSYDDELWAFGRCVAARKFRDERVRLGEGVVVIDGKFFGFGGSRNNPVIGKLATESVVLEIRDVPVALIEPERERWDRYNAARANWASETRPVVTFEVLQDAELPATLPQPVVNSFPDRLSDAEVAVVESFERLSATQQARVLARLHDSLPAAQLVEA